MSFSQVSFSKSPGTGSATSPYMKMLLQNPCLYRGYDVSCAGGQDDRTLGSRSARIVSAEQEVVAEQQR